MYLVWFALWNEYQDFLVKDILFSLQSFYEIWSNITNDNGLPCTPTTHVYKIATSFLT
jgi:hypothetical protein